MKRFLIFIYCMALIIGPCIAQPGGGQGGGNQGCSGPNPPSWCNDCNGPNPPPSCGSVPIEGEFILIIAGLILGLGYLYYKRRQSIITPAKQTQD